jgi:hypothetical protein
MIHCTLHFCFFCFLRQLKSFYFSARKNLTRPSMTFGKELGALFSGSIQWNHNMPHGVNNLNMFSWIEGHIGVLICECIDLVLSLCREGHSLPMLNHNFQTYHRRRWFSQSLQAMSHAIWAYSSKLCQIFVSFSWNPTYCCWKWGYFFPPKWSTTWHLARGAKIYQVC